MSPKQKRILHIPVKKMYFDQIKAGTKLFEFRLRNAYWQQRLQDKEFDEVHIKLGYPKRGDTDRILVFPWRGVEMQTILHPEFGPCAVDVYAIRVN